jgi:hypothetical protein
MIEKLLLWRFSKVEALRIIGVSILSKSDFYFIFLHFFFPKDFFLKIQPKVKLNF